MFCQTITLKALLLTCLAWGLSFAFGYLSVWPSRELGSSPNFYTITLSIFFLFVPFLIAWNVHREALPAAHLICASIMLVVICIFVVITIDAFAYSIDAIRQSFTD
jgi:glucan phosphoethanolaminetransferase (alkaline phosphatase superfamily)